MEKYKELLKYYRKQDGYSAIAFCANVFIRGDLPCDPEISNRLEYLRDKAFEVWQQTHSNAGLSKETLIHQAVMSLVRSQLD